VRYNTNVGTKAFTLASADKAHEALEPANRSLELAEKIYPKNDPRLHKSLRVLATVKSKQDKFDEAEKLYLRYFYFKSATYCVQQQYHPTTHQCTHPSIQFQPIHPSIRCNAMRCTCRSYTLLCIAPVAGPQCPEAQGIVDDLCSMLIHRKHDFAAAEKYARSNYQSLTDKKLGMVW
jgi:hypothetical protein